MSRDGEPSTLFVFWNDAESPFEEEVRLAITAALPGASFPDEQLETDEEVSWAFLVRWAETDHEAIVWCELRNGPYEEQLERALEGEALDAARACRWWIGIETWLAPEALSAGFQHQLALAATVALPGFVAAYDEGAGRVIAETEVRDLVSCPTPPRARHLYSIQRAQGAGGSWLHTYGMSRLSLPELDLLGVPGDALPSGYELLEAVADSLIEGRECDAEGNLDLGESIRVRAIPMERATRMLEPELVRMVEGRELGGPRLVLLDSRRTCPPLRLLTRSGSGASSSRALYRSVDETRRMRSLALARWGTFGQLFVMHQGEEGWRFLVKLAHGRSGSGQVREHLWFEVLGLKPGMVHVRLLSRPIDVQTLEVGVASWQSLDRLTDWLVHGPSGSYDPERAPQLLAD